MISVAAEPGLELNPLPSGPALELVLELQLRASTELFLELEHRASIELIDLGPNLINITYQNIVVPGGLS